MGNQLTSFTGGNDPPCFSGNLVGPDAGVIVEVVVVTGAGICKDGGHPNFGVVFYDRKPKIWTCLSQIETTHFEAWCKANFPRTAPIHVTSPLPSLNCPPTVQVDGGAGEAAFRDTLERLGQTWLRRVA